MKITISVFSFFCLSHAFAANSPPLDVSRLPIVQSGLICANGSRSSQAVSALNTLMNTKIEDSHVVVMENNTYFLACALISSQ